MATLTDTEPVVLEDLEFAPVCQIRKSEVTAFAGVVIVTSPGVQCDNEATQVLLCRKCGASAYTCADHAAWVFSERVMNCSACHAVGDPADLFDLVGIGVDA